MGLERQLRVSLETELDSVHKRNRTVLGLFGALLEVAGGPCAMIFL